MKRGVIEAIAASNKKRSTILQQLSGDQRRALLEQMFREFFVDQHLTLQKWAALTGQSAQVDTGYIAQFVASVCLGIPGQGFRGKGDDLIDGSEVKAAANTSGVDRPRWNHNLGTPAADAERRKKGAPTASEQYLSSPYVFYLLVDRVVGGERAIPSIRVRAWCIDGQQDSAWRDLVQLFVNERGPKQYNLQLHPPVGYDDNLVVNTLGNLDFSDVLLFDMRIQLDESDGTHLLVWELAPTFPLQPIIGRTRSLAYGTDERPSQLTSATDLVADVATLPNLFPGLLTSREEDALEEAAELDQEIAAAE